VTLLERRHGPAVVLAPVFGAGIAGALVASAMYPYAVVSGASGAALGLLAAWPVPNLQPARAREYWSALFHPQCLSSRTGGLLNRGRP